jgi:thiamine biosynthesis lipoprotein
MVGCNSDSSGKVTTFVFNTIVEVTINDHYSDELADDIETELLRLDNLFSRYVKDSDISKINDHSGTFVDVDGEVISVIIEAIRYSELSDGAFDVTMGPIVDLWSIGTGKEIPSSESVMSTLELVDYNKIEIDHLSIKIEEGMSIDLGGILKGYAADRIQMMLDGNSVKSAIVNLGGNLYLQGMKDDQAWRIGIRDPFGNRDDYLGIIKISSQSVVTSGTYERFDMVDDIKYHHIFSSETGYPVNNGIESVTIISDLSIDADALTTTVFAMGVDKGLALLEELTIDGIIIDQDKNIFITKEIQNQFELKDDSFKLVY